MDSKKKKMYIEFEYLSRSCCLLRFVLEFLRPPLGIPSQSAGIYLHVRSAVRGTMVLRACELQVIFFCSYAQHQHIQEIYLVLKMGQQIYIAKMIFLLSLSSFNLLAEFWIRCALLRWWREMMSMGSVDLFAAFARWAKCECCVWWVSTLCHGWKFSLFIIRCERSRNLKSWTKPIKVNGSFAKNAFSAS